MKIKKIAVIGAGMMGAGIAQVFAQKDIRVMLNDISEEALQKGLDAVSRFMDEGIRRKKTTPEDKERVFGNIQTTTSLQDALRDCDFVIEAVFEKVALKQDIFREIEKYAPHDIYLATNTSSISIAEIAASIETPSRVVGMHFNSPVPASLIVEVVRSIHTDEEAVKVAVELCGLIGKEHIVSKDFPGFVPSRIGTILINQAFYILEQGVATPEDINKAVKLTFRHPMGPFDLADYIGLDTILRVIEYLHREFGDMYRPSPLLKNYVKAGLLGRKAGRGVFDYKGEKSIY